MLQVGSFGHIQFHDNFLLSKKTICSLVKISRRAENGGLEIQDTLATT